MKGIPAAETGFSAKEAAGNLAGSLANRVGGNFLSDAVRDQIERERGWK